MLNFELPVIPHKDINVLRLFTKYLVLIGVKSSL